MCEDVGEAWSRGDADKLCDSNVICGVSIMSDADPREGLSRGICNELLGGNVCVLMGEGVTENEGARDETTVSDVQVSIEGEMVGRLTGGQGETEKSRKQKARLRGKRVSVQWKA